MVFLPLLVVIITGLMLMLKKDVGWIQPPTAKGSGETNMTMSMDEILTAARSVAEAEISDWEDIDRLDVRPSKGLVKVRSENNWEIQIDLGTGAILQTKYRRSDIIESLHDGSWFSKGAKYWVFLPSGVVLLGLWATGIYLWILPYMLKRKRNQRKAHPKDSGSQGPSPVQHTTSKTPEAA